MRECRALFMRDMRIYFGRGVTIALPIAFLALVAMLFVFALGPDDRLIRQSAPAILSVALVLASLLSLEKLFKDDARHGALTRWMFAPLPLPLLVLTKTAAHWVAVHLPLLLLSPLLAIMLGVSTAHVLAILLALSLLSITVTLAGALGSALALGTKDRSLLLPVILTPLLIPPLIFASGAMTAILTDASFASHLYLLTAYGLFLFVITPFAASYAIREIAGQC